ncbi:ABC transporter substrate-binding protein [Paenibacillus sp. L3-i20]|uniref:ABC transporter substrate-binding protein n=1 Tax=Paenibacillus sp. L3-i20 TaxID=2905833 RepID=UPI001EDDF186|nr:ABC transporter substrate-binding protein [Paenibacillus sp. L3-i20]GKU75867.1 ferrichrome ABC transporter substrate-binding protein [Paenibacillus sp. L3-i20]
MKAIQFTFATICLTVTFLAATGCNNNQAPATPASSSTTEVVNTTTKSSFERVIKHVAGETILKEAPRNIAILDYSYIDYLTALEMKPGSTVSFVDNELPPYLSEQVQADEITFLGPIGGVNPEKVLAADPDLIIGTSPGQEKIYDQLSKISNTILLSQSAFDWRHTLNEFANIIGKEDKAIQLIANYDEKMKASAELVKATIGNESVLFLRVLEKDYRVYGKVSPAGSVLYNDLALKAPEGVPMDKKLQVISIEVMPELNPDHIFLLVQEDAEEKMGELQNNPLWKNINAVKNNRIYPVDQRLWIQGEGPIASSIMLDQAVKELTKK